MYFRIAITLMLVCLIPGGFLIGTLASYGYQSIASMIPVLRVILLGISLMFAFLSPPKLSLSKIHVYYLLFYAVYHAYAFYYILIAPEVPRADMLDVPLENSVLYRDFFIQTLTVLLVGIYRRFIDFRLFAKVTSVLVAVLFYFYYSNVGFATYGIEDFYDNKLFSEEQVIVSFRLARFFAIAFFCCLACKSLWFKSEKMNSVLTYLLSVILLAGLILTVKRGPILSLFVTTLYWYFIKTKAKHIVRSLLLWGLVILFFGNIFADFIENYMGGLADRIETTVEGGSSGRFGSSTSVYAISLQQIEEGPLFGSNFRLKNGLWLGSHPHNFILEMLMTFGIVFTAVFVPLFWKVQKRINLLIKQDSSATLAATCFLYVFCASMTSGSVFLHTEFWVFLSILCSYRISSNKTII